MAIEDELETCPACEGKGMTAGAVCGECRGRGITRVPHAVVALPEDDDDDTPDMPVENRSKAELVELAAELGIDASGKRDELLERIQAHQAAAEAGDEPANVADAAPEPVVDPGPNAADATPAEAAAEAAADAKADAEAAAPAEPAAEADDGLDDLNVAQLRERLAEAGLETKGKRDELLERLRS